MRSGSLRHKIVIEQKSVTKNSYGEESVSWTTYATLWASIEPLRGREYFDAQQINAEETLRFRVRYILGIKPVMRIKFGTRIFNIKSAANIKELNKELEILATEVV